MSTVANNIIIFFTNQTQNITSIPYVFSGDRGSLKVWGTWDGANIALYTGVPGDSLTYIPVGTDASGTPLILTDTASVGIENIVQNETLVAILSNAGISTDLNCTLQKVVNG